MTMKDVLRCTILGHDVQKRPHIYICAHICKCASCCTSSWARGVLAHVDDECAGWIFIWTAASWLRLPLNQRGDGRVSRYVNHCTRLKRFDWIPRRWCYTAKLQEYRLASACNAVIHFAFWIQRQCSSQLRGQGSVLLKPLGWLLWSTGWADLPFKWREWYLGIEIHISNEWMNMHPNPAQLTPPPVNDSGSVNMATISRKLLFCKCLCML